MLPVIFVVLTEKAKKKKDRIIKELTELCQEELPEYAQPEEIFVIDKLPLTPIGKIDYRDLENRVNK